MCMDPATATLALTAVSTAIGAYGMQRQTSAANDAARYNADMASQQATYAEERGRASEEQLRRQSAQLTGTQRNRLAATGADIQFGSALDITGDTAALTAMDAATIRENAEREAWALRSGAALDRASTSSPTLAAAPTVLGGATEFADRWYRFRGQG